MTSPPLDSTNGLTMSGKACHHRLWVAHTDEQHRAWHAIIAFGQHTRLNDVGRGIPSSPLGSTDGRTASGVACDHRLLPSHTVEQRRAWHAIITLGKHKLSNNVRRDMSPPPLDSIHNRTTSGVACHHRLWAAHTVERSQAWHAIIALERQTRLNDVRRGMPSSPLD